MGLDIGAKGLEGFSIGYITFNCYRDYVAEHYDAHVGTLYKMAIRNAMAMKTECLNEQQWAKWEQICPKPLDEFLFHPDCEGNFTPKQCREIYKVLVAIKADDSPCGKKTFSGWHELFLEYFKHCADKRVILRFC